MNTTPPPKFSNYFNKIIVELPNETILWDRRVHGRTDSDGFEISRTGNESIVAKIYMMPRYNCPQYSVKKELSDLISIKQGTIASILKAIWLYIRDKSPRRTEDASILDPNLRNILMNGNSVNELRFRDIPALLKPHLGPPHPFIVEHKISFAGDWTVNEQAFDLFAETPRDMRPLESAKMPHLRQLTDRVQLLENESNFAESQIESHLAKRHLCRAFISDPCRFIKTLVVSKQTDQSKEDIWESERRRRTAQFWEQPWTNLAISKYLRLKGTKDVSPVAKRRRVDGDDFSNRSISSTTEEVNHSR
eukprot:GHVL01043070.1.p1 GENE.GHVL01043070.1~~GHVL01043070.1.p1  ORF type:complete len:306 (+),score=62.39 GHVL01043070.1:194-1111(+)